jgi:predicted ester cyclase
MPVAVELEFAGGTLEQYDEVLRRMGYEPRGSGHPDGLFHWVAEVDEGLRIVEVWDSSNAFLTFAQDTLGPITAAVGVGEPAVTVHEVHNYLVGPRFASGSARDLAAVERAIGRWNAGDLDGYLELYDDAIWLHGYAPEPMDKTAVRGYYADVLAAFPGAQLHVEDLITSAGRVTIRFVMTGRHEGRFMGVAPTGVEIALPGITILAMRDGRCIERWSQADMLGLLAQVGAVPPPGG